MRVGGSEHNAREGLRDGQEDVCLDGRAALGAAAAFFAVDDCSDVLERDVVGWRGEGLAVDDGRVGLGRMGRRCKNGGTVLCAEVSRFGFYIPIKESPSGARIDEAGPREAAEEQGT